MINYLHEWYDGINDCYEHNLRFDIIAMYLEGINDMEDS